MTGLRGWVGALGVLGAWSLCARVCVRVCANACARGKGERLTLSHRVFWHLLKGHCLPVRGGVSPLEHERKQEREVGRKWINEQM